MFRSRRKMLKSEFEFLIGKEVDNDTFAMYETMYMALPDKIDKRKFISMLNIDAIPESEESIHRHEEKEQFISGIKDEIDRKKQDIKYFQAENERYKIMLKDKSCSEMNKDIKSWIKSNNRHIENLRIAIKELSWVVKQ